MEWQHKSLLEDIRDELKDNNKLLQRIVELLEKGVELDKILGLNRK